MMQWRRQIGAGLVLRGGAVALGLLASGLELGRVAQAGVGRRLELSQRDDSVEQKARIVHLLQQGLEWYHKGQFQEALQSCEAAPLQGWEAALRISREIGNRQDEAGSLGNLGLAYEALGQDERAINFFQQSLVITYEIGDRQRKARLLRTIIGNIYERLEQYEQAINFHHQNFSVVREIGDRKGAVESLSHLGNSHHSTSQYEQDICFHQKSALRIMG